MKKIIIGLTGEMSSGKSTVAKYLIEEHKASSHRFSDVLRNVLDVIYIEKSRANLQKLSTNLRDLFGQDLLAKTITCEVEKDTHEVIVVDGVRREEDVKYLKEIPGFKLMYIKVSLEARYKRLLEREENSDDKGKTFEEFKKEQNQEAEEEIKGLEKKADIVIENEGTLDELKAKIDLHIRG